MIERPAHFELAYLAWVLAVLVLVMIVAKLFLSPKRPRCSR